MGCAYLSHFISFHRKRYTVQLFLLRTLTSSHYIIYKSQKTVLLQMEILREIGNRVVRRVYLVTYSRADANLCDTRDRFAELVLQAFNFQRGGVRALHWVVCREAHEGGGFHYHMAICLSSNKRWLPAKRALGAMGIQVHFQDRDDVVNYVGTYIYICKSD